jgi:UDP-N-acetylglucosamine--N-acetylmuramyl-(pentapeptide) pyrophosphoryl-undecaprenol N-acetylglucosamine transferase
MTICFVAGKSGGHLIPCITKAYKIQEQNPQTKLYLFSSGSDLDNTIMNKNKNIKHIIPTLLDNPPYHKPWLLPWFACKTGWYYLKSLYYLQQIKPQKVISFGGFISIPLILAAKTIGIPFEIYELNVEPGKATTFLSKITDTIYICFHETAQYFPNKKCIYFDYPVRFDQNDLIFNKEDLLQRYNLIHNKLTILILGGSQGSILLNNVFKDMIQENPNIAKKIQVIHQTGASDPYNYQQFYKSFNIPCNVFSYSNQLQDFYNLADIIICRAGAGTMFEIKFFNKKCITIPHKTAQTDHQIKNVLELQKEFPRNFHIIKQDDFTVKTLLTYLQQLNML